MKVKATISTEQEKAFNNVVKAIEFAKSKGLEFYGKQENLVAYTKQAADYENKHGIERLTTRYETLGGLIPHIGKRCLSDSGADDYSHFLKGDVAI